MNFSVRNRRAQEPPGATKRACNHDNLSYPANTIHSFHLDLPTGHDILKDRKRTNHNDGRPTLSDVEIRMVITRQMTDQTAI